MNKRYLEPWERELKRITSLKSKGSSARLEKEFKDRNRRVRTNKGIQRKKIYPTGSLLFSLSFSEIAPFHRPTFSLKGSTTEKEKGIMMLDKIEYEFNISDFDKEEWRKEMKIKEEEDFEEMEKQAHERKFKDPFTRDEKGNIISPFRSKEKIKW